MSDEANEETSKLEAPAARREWARVVVPAWMMGLVALLAVGALGFGVARWTDSGDGGHRGGPPAAGMARQHPGNGGGQGNQDGPNDRRPMGPGNQQSGNQQSGNQQNAPR